MSAVFDEQHSSQHVNRLLWLAAAAGAEDEVRRHIARGDCLEWRDRRGLTPLMAAASRDRANICLLLLEAGVDALVLDGEGRDALTIAKDAGALAAAETIAGWIPQKGKETGGCSLANNPSTVAPGDGHVEQEPATTENYSSVVAEGSQHGEADWIDHETPDVLTSGWGSLGDWEPAPHTSAPPDMPDIAHMQASRQQQISQHQPVDRRAFWGRLEEQGEQEEPAKGAPDDWEPVATSLALPDKLALLEAESLRQKRISAHAPIDRAAAWEEFEVELPQLSTPLRRADDADLRTEFRRLMLMALREGSVPQITIEDLFSGGKDSDTHHNAAGELLLIVLAELGAGADERLPHSVGDECHTIYVDPVESDMETHEVDEALEFFEDLRSGINDPLHIYLRSMGRRLLLKADEEVAIAQAMEAAVERALDALATWPAGLQALLDSVAGAAAKPAILLPIVATFRDEGEADEDAGETTEAASAEDEDLPSETSASTGSTAEALDGFSAIHKMAPMLVAQPGLAAEIRTRLGLLRFRRPFLARLADITTDRCAESKVYRDAISELLESRDLMARANLRLVYAIARRYVHTGVPLEDLIQEGNIGLLKAIDRFDWRRGHKFSTMAVWWVKQAIRRSIADTAFLIRPPVHVHEMASKLRNLTEASERACGRALTVAERMALLSMPIQKIEMIDRPLSEPLPIEDAEGACVLDEQPDPMEVIAHRQIERLVSDKLSGLKRKQEAVLRMRTGIGLDDVLTLEQVGSRFEVTRERVRQIESQAMRALASIRVCEELALATGRTVPARRTTAVTEPARAEETGAPLSTPEESP